MALIVEYHVVADMYPVGDTAITAGMAVCLTNGLVVPASNTTGAAGKCLGIAGDSKLTAEGQTTAYSDQVVIGANGANTRWTENRVSDFYDETKASDKITVYNGGGKFWISSTLFDSDAASVAAGNTLAPSSSVDGEWATGASDDDIVALAVGASQAYPSGVPGTDTTDGSITLGNFVPVVLRV